MADLNEVFQDLRRRFGPAPALYSADGQVLSFADLDRIVRRFASRLRREGVAPGAGVVVLVDNRAVRLCLIFALLRIGAAPVLAESVRGPRVAGVRVDLAVALPDQVSDEVPSVIFGQDWRDGAEDIADPAPAAGLWFGSSGATGAPKYLYRPAESLLALIAHRQGFAGGVAGPLLLGVDPGLQVGFQLLLAAFMGGHGVTWPVATPEKTLARIREAGATDAMMPPLLLHQLVEAGEADAAPPGLERLVIGGAAADGTLLARAARVFGTSPICLMGSTETGLVGGAAYDPENWAEGRVGPLAPGVEARITDEDGALLRAGEAGHLAIRPPAEHRIEAYANSAPVGDGAGWFSTGDLAELSARGELTLLARADERITLGGAKYTPALLEAMFRDLAGGRLLAAIALPDAAGGGLGLAVEGGDAAFAATLGPLAAARLGIGVRVVSICVERLPQNRAGKIDRWALLRKFGAD